MKFDGVVTKIDLLDYMDEFSEELRYMKNMYDNFTKTNTECSYMEREHIGHISSFMTAIDVFSDRLATLLRDKK